MKSSKVIIYGTGLLAKKFISFCADSTQILCCIDKSRFNGYCDSIPIKTWENIEPGMADRLVIAANPKHVREIYYRVIYDCDRNGLGVFDWRGTDLRKAYGYEYVSPALNHQFVYDYKEKLIQEINKHDVISFDLFDTLIMRRVMEPHDIYDYVDCLLPDDCAVKGKFKGIRRESELDTDSVINGFDGIYSRIAQLAGLSDEEIDSIAGLEVKSEKEVLVRRKGIKEIFDYAVYSGKKVYIISDMYFGKDFLSSILNSLGIHGYEDVFVSCDYRKTKSRGLFEIYKSIVNAKSYLHIGDNYEADMEAAEKCGIDGFLIPSGIDMLRASNLRRILLYSKGDFNRRVIGELIALLFNDPFSLCGTNGDIKVFSVESIGKCAVTPIVYLYVNRLIDIVLHGDYDRILLGARDGYIIDRIIKEIDSLLEKDKFFYMYISRSLAFKLGMGYPVVDEDYQKYLEVDDRRKIEDDRYYMEGLEEKPYRREKDAYERYLNDNDISYSGKYLFCDMISGGTVQHSLNVLFENGLRGFYLKRTFAYMDRKLDYTALFEREEFVQDQLLVDRLETLICSPEQSVKGIAENGTFLFEKETRSEKELLLLQEMQDEITDGVKMLMCFEDIYSSKLDKNLTVACLMMLDHMLMCGDVSQMKEWIYHDSNGEKVKLFK